MAKSEWYQAIRSFLPEPDPPEDLADQEKHRLDQEKKKRRREYCRMALLVFLALVVLTDYLYFCELWSLTLTTDRPYAPEVDRSAWHPQQSCKECSHSLEGCEFCHNRS